MLLVEWTPTGGSLTRISTEDVALTYQWFGYITSLASLKIQMAEKYGGYCKPSFSDITLSPEMFDGAWPPAKEATVTIKWTETTEAAAVTLLTGTAHRDEFDRDGVQYTFRQPEFDDTLGPATLNATLSVLMGTWCTAIGVTLSNQSTRSTTTEVDYTYTDDVQTIDMMSNVCAFFTHAFKIVSGVLYLYDLLESETATALTEFDILPSSYSNEEPISLVTCVNDSVSGSNPNGEEISISTSYALNTATTEAALTNITTVLEYDISIINAKFDNDKPTVLDCITLTDESTIEGTTSTSRVVSIVYNFDTLDMEMEAIGTIT